MRLSEIARLDRRRLPSNKPVGGQNPEHTWLSDDTRERAATRLPCDATATRTWRVPVLEYGPRRIVVCTL